MLTEITVRNFKRFAEAVIPLGDAVVFVGPNNSGKTTALQALALWDYGLRKWLERRSGKGTPERRPGVTITRRELAALPVPDAKMLWRDLKVQTGKGAHIPIDVIVRGVTDGKPWECGLEFDHASEESLYVRPMRLAEGKTPKRMPVPEQAAAHRVVFLPPMSGIVLQERKIELGAIHVSLGEGRTAEVLRNLCFHLLSGEEGPARWKDLVDRIERLFGVRLEEPEYDAGRGEITMSYREAGRILDLSCGGRGLHQTLLLLAHLGANPRSVLLLDEPDAHLEFLRQRQIYQVLTDAARATGGQVVAASHSEVLLNEAADRDIAVAFVGKPHRIDDRGSQVLKALKEIGFEHFVQAEQRGWVLYLEGATDFAILRAFAHTLGHEAAMAALERPFVHYVGNQPSQARAHFHALREAKPDLVAFSVYDRIVKSLQATPELDERMWSKREIENYLCLPEALMSLSETLAVEESGGPLFEPEQRKSFRSTMEACIKDFTSPAALRDRKFGWWSSVKATDEYLDPLFEKFFERLGLPNLLRKTDYHRLAPYVPSNLLDPEIREVLDAIVGVARRAKPTAMDGP